MCHTLKTPIHACNQTRSHLILDNNQDNQTRLSARFEHASHHSIPALHPDSPSPKQPITPRVYGTILPLYRDATQDQTVHSSILQLYRLLKESGTIIKRSQSTEYSGGETLKKFRTSSGFEQGTVGFCTHATTSVSEHFALIKMR